MSKIFNFLTEMKSKLEAVDGIETLKIGLEKGIGSKDTPFIRIVPESNTKSKTDEIDYCKEKGKTKDKSCIKNEIQREKERTMIKSSNG